MTEDIKEKIKKTLLKIRDNLDKNGSYYNFILFLLSFAALAFVPATGILFFLTVGTVLVTGSSIVYQILDGYEECSGEKLMDSLKGMFACFKEEKKLISKSLIALISLIVFYFLCLIIVPKGPLFDVLTSLGILGSATFLIYEGYEIEKEYKQNIKKIDEEYQLDESKKEDDYSYFVEPMMEKSVSNLNASWQEEDSFMDRCYALSEEINALAFSGYENILDEIYGIMQGYTFEKEDPLLKAKYEEALFQIEKDLQSKIGLSRKRTLR